MNDIAVHEEFMNTITTGKQLREFRNKLPRTIRSAEKFAAEIGYSGRQILDVESKEKRNKKFSEELRDAIADFRKQQKESA